MNENLVCVGKIVASHGINGAVKVKTYTEFPDSLLEYAPLFNKLGDKQFDLEFKSMSGDILILYINNTKSRNDADALKNIELYADKSKFPELEEEEFFYEDLTGLRAIERNGSFYGKIVAVHDFGSGDIIEIELKDSKKTEMIAFTKENFPKIDVKGGKVLLCLPEKEYVASESNDSDTEQGK